MSHVKVVIHVHTNYSYDANTSPEELIAAARRQGVDCIAITDHNDIGGALHARRIAAETSGRPVGIIVGEEISSTDGHILGLFLEDRVPRGLSGEETIARIRAQGGLVLAPHPYSTLCDKSLHDTLERLRPHVDAVEVCNAQNPLPWQDARAARFARRHRITPYVGADSHVRGYLDGCHQVMPASDGPAGFLAALRQAELHPGRFGLGYLAAMGVRHVWEHVLRRRCAGFGVNVPALQQLAQEQQAGPAPAPQEHLATTSVNV
jgi:hypothetical protein